MNRIEATVTTPTLAAQQKPDRGPVLVVDGDPAVRRVLRLVLEGAGFRCFASETVEDAESLVARVQPKLVLVEVNPLEQGGFHLAGRLAAGDGWRPRVALMSAYPRPRRGFEDYFLPKPIEFDRLLDLLETIEREQTW